MKESKSLALTQYRKSNSKCSQATYGTSNNNFPSQEDQEAPEFYFTLLEVIKNLSLEERKQIIEINLLDSLDQISQIQQMFPDKQDLIKKYQELMLKQIKKIVNNNQRVSSKIIEMKKENEEN